MKKRFINISVIILINILLIFFYTNLTYAGGEPDIVNGSITLNPPNPDAGQSVIVDWQYNMGGDGWNDNKFAIFVSDQCTLRPCNTSGQWLVIGDGCTSGTMMGTGCDTGTDNVAAGGPYNMSRSINIPSGLTPGYTYYVIVAMRNYNMQCNPNVNVADQECKSFTIPLPPPYIKIIKEAQGTASLPGGLVLYTIHYDIGNVTNARITDDVPSNVDVVEIYDGGTLSAGTITWNLGNIGTPRTGRVSYLARVKGTVPLGTVIDNYAYAQANEVGPVTSNNAQVTVGPSLKMGKSVTPTAADVGSILTFYLSYTNEGFALTEYVDFNQAGDLSDWTNANGLGNWIVNGNGELEQTDTSAGQWPKYIKNSPSQHNGMYITDMMVPSTGNASFDAVIIFNYVDLQNMYFGRIQSDTNQICFDKVVGNSWSQVQCVSPVGFSIQNDRWYTMKVQVIGNNIRIKAWPRGDPEPAGWAINITDTSFSGVPGKVGYQANEGRDYYDNLKIFSPVAATNTRLWDTLPNCTTYIDCTGGCSYNAGTRVVSWNLGTIYNEVGMVSFRVSVDACAANSVITNTGCIDSDEAPPSVCGQATVVIGSIATNTPTPTSTRTYTPTNTFTPTFTRTNTPTNTITNTPSNTVTNTPTNTITNTFTNTITNTWTNTRTNTQTNTITNTTTNTFTNTPTNTRTNTPTNTITNTFTNTITNTPTNTITNTFTNTTTNTPTNTFTLTNTRTNTPTNTITNTPTNTITNTPTNTITNTFTNTITNTPTNTFTLTNTRTNTPTNTLTNTATDTPTRTATPTETWTGTQPPTWTPTNTFTFTFTRTNTATSTDTPTRTNTNTPTDTFTPTYTRTNTATPTETQTGTPPPTWTPTNTFTNTRTNTPSFTDTNTFTCTNTPTNTNTVTNTRTPTNTATDTNTYIPTPTNTYTITNTRTFTNTPTNTNTFTNTNTPTYTFTRTNTNTETATFTVTFTATDTPTRTATPTITLTLPPFPYIITISIYNEAGEIVKQLSSVMATDKIENIMVLVDDAEGSIVSSGKKMSIYLPGIETPETISKGGTEFIWDVTNNNGQIVNNGVYYIKVEQKDIYGHSLVVTRDIQVANLDEYIELKIFNSAGELVKTIREFKTIQSDKIKLNINDVINTSDASRNINIIYGLNPDDSIIWDGKNDEGVLVSNGTYEIQVIIKNIQGQQVVASKTVVILNENTQRTKEFKVYPNPILKKGGNKALFKWECESGGVASIFIYNSAGDLIRKENINLQDKLFSWDLKTASGKMVSPGLYVCVLESRNETGFMDKQITKLVILR